MAILKSWTQCFLFVICDNMNNDLCEGRSSPGHGKIKGYVLLPNDVLIGHPKICQSFKRSDVIILSRSECVTLSVLLKNSQVDIVELILAKGKVPRNPQVLAEVGNVGFVKPILGKYFSVRKIKSIPRVVRSAVDKTNSKVLINILTHKKDIGYRNPRGGALLHLSVLRSSPVLLNLLLENGVDIDFRRKDGSTALHLAVLKGNVAFVKLLVESGASLDVRKNDHSTCLYLAARRKHEQIFELLCQSGATLPNEVIGYSKLLQIAVQNNFTDVVPKLLSHGSESILKTVERHGMFNALLPIAVEKGHVEIVKQLLEHGADGNTLIPDGRSILHLAVVKENLEMVEIILKYSCNVKNECKNKKALRESILRKGVNFVKITKMLLQHGLTVDVDDVNNAELFHTAVRRNYLEVIEQLLSCGANVNIKFYDPEKYYGNITPLIVAIRYGNKDILDLLLRNGADANEGCGWNCKPVIEAIYEFDASAVKMLLEYKAQITDPEVLIAAVRRGKQEMVEALLQHGANPNGKCYYRNSDGDIPLSIAVMHNNLKLVDMLLKYGADINGSNGNRSIPLHIACDFGHRSVVEYLIKNNADIEKRNEIGATALSCAAQIGHFGIVDMLLNAGACYDFLNIQDESVADCPFMETPDYMFKFFFDHGVADKTFMRVMGHLFKVASEIETIFNHKLWCSVKNMELRLARHMIKLEAAGLHFNKLNLMPEWYKTGKTKENFRKNCEAEVSIMKTQNIENANVSYYDILISGLRRLTCYARNDDVAKMVSAEDLMKSFPIYASIIYCQLQKGIFQRDLLKDGVQSFHFVFKEFPKLPDEVVEKILSCMRNQDIMVFMNAVSPMKV